MWIRVLWFDPGQELFLSLSFPVCKFGTTLTSGVALTLQRGGQYSWSMPEKAPASLAPLGPLIPACLHLQGLVFVKEQRIRKKTCP